MLKDNIRAERSRARIKQTELAEMLGVTSQTIANYEAGRTEPSYSKIIEIAQALGVGLDKLIDN